MSTLLKFRGVEELDTACWFKDKHGSWQPQPREWRQPTGFNEHDEKRMRIVEQKAMSLPLRICVKGKWFYLTNKPKNVDDEREAPIKRPWWEPWADWQAGRRA